MPRRARVAPGGLVYHVLNRSVGKMKMFRREGDYDAFCRVMGEAHERHPIRILSLCVMPSHWHFVVWPRADGQTTDFFRWLAHTHAMRWRTSHHTVGYGHLYQGRFKSFPVQADSHLRTVCRYVERNPLTAGLVTRAEQWKWSSLWLRAHGTDEQKALLADWPVPIPSDWTARVNAALTDKERARIRTSIDRNRPFGDDDWVARAVRRLHLEHTVRREGRPTKARPAEPGGSAG
jgi:putative transposase